MPLPDGKVLGEIVPLLSDTESPVNRLSLGARVTACRQ